MNCAGTYQLKNLYSEMNTTSRAAVVSTYSTVVCPLRPASSFFISELEPRCNLCGAAKRAIRHHGEIYAGAVAENLVAVKTAAERNL